MTKKRIFVVCPVRPPKVGLLKRMINKYMNWLSGAVDSWTEKQNAIKKYVAKLETDGYDVFWPRRDNRYQNTDRIGLLICEYNRERMLEADEVHIWCDKNSTGSVFDIGMFYMFVRTHSFKKFVIINREDIAPTPHKSFENVILALAKEFDNPVANGLRERWERCK